MVFNPLDSSVKYVKGVGPARAKYLNLLGIYTIRDLLYYPPRKYIDSSHMKNMRDVRKGDEVTVVGEIIDVYVRKTRKGKIGTVVLFDGTGSISGKWFNQDWVVKYFKKGETVALSGKVSMFGFEKQIISPEYEKMDRSDYENIHTGRIVPVYRINRFLTQRSIRRFVKNAIEKYLNNIKDYFNLNERERFDIVDIKTAIRNLHFPKDRESLNKAIKRLAFEEIFLVELFLRMQKVDIKSRNGIKFDVDSRLVCEFKRSLPFELTEAQKRVFDEIKKDMSRPVPMQRLLQGDVGSGKTVVAVMASLIAVENGYNAAIMVPTEVLAFQHHRVISALLSSLNVDVYLITGSIKKEEKESILEELSKKRGIVIGTHALIQKEFHLPYMGLAIIDEQHRFGVLQRKKLISYPENPDVLFLTATPIPRTLAIAVYGDLDVSTINKLPPGRVPPVTKWITERDRHKIYSFVKQKVQNGDRAYIVLPLIEGNSKMDIKAVKDTYRELKNTFFKEVPMEMLFGSMNSSEKDRVMNGFRKGEIKVLVCTTVVEVGVDVPEANIMVIENADRFGLSQLHQLRGRIGRGGGKSYCFLITPESITEEAGRRLRAMERFSDGFRLSEEDLKIRGPGEFFGTRQHGFSDFLFFDIYRDSYLIEPVKRFVDKIAEKKEFYRFNGALERVASRGELFQIA